MDELVVIIMGVFIANYKAEEHPYLTNCAKAFLIALLGLIWFAGKEFVNNTLTLERLKFILTDVLCLWFFLSLSLIFLEFIFKASK